MGHSKLLISIAILGACGGKTADPQADAAGEVVHVVAHDVSPPLRDLAKLARPSRVADEAPEAEPVRRLPLKHFKTLRAQDTAIQTAFGATPIVATAANFEGMGAGIPGFVPGGVPPDTD